VIGLLFEWSPAKAYANWRKHGVAFREAMTVFADPMSRTVSDPDHSVEEHRYVTIGRASSRRLLVVIHTDRGDRIRIVSARAATRSEQRKL
jgi:uncharacterized protein